MAPFRPESKAPVSRVFLGHPREAPQPIREDALLTGPLEPTNEPYALAKIAGIKLCESFNRQYGAPHDGPSFPQTSMGPSITFIRRTLMSFRRYCAASMKRSSPRLRKW